MRSKESQNRNFNRLPEPSLKLVSFFKEASRNCIARYALSRVIHRIQSEIYFGNPDWYLKWLGTVTGRPLSKELPSPNKGSQSCFINVPQLRDIS